MISCKCDCSRSYSSSIRSWICSTVTFQIDYVFIDTDNIINGTPDAVGRTVSFNIPTSSVTRGVSSNSVNIDMTGFNPLTQTCYYKISRLGATDAFAQDISIIGMDFGYTARSIGMTYT